MKKIQITARTRAPEPITQSVLDKAVERGKRRQNTDKVFGLADWLEDQYDPTHKQAQAAAELRRLHAENERLHQINQSHEMKLSVRGYEIQIADFEAQRDQLLEALKSLVKSTARICDGSYGDMMDNDFLQARAAIRSVEDT